MFKALRKTFNDAVSELAACAVEISTQKLTRSLVIGMAPKARVARSPVLVIPGFLSGDWHTAPLRDFLDAVGYKSYDSKCPINPGVDAAMEKKLEKRLVEIYHESGGQPVDIVGESIGGLYADMLKRRYPLMVGKIVSLGTPRSGINQPGSLSAVAAAAYRAINKESAHCLEDDSVARYFGTPHDGPLTAIYSENDRIVSKKTALTARIAPDEKDAKRESVRIPASHIGMAYNLMAWVVIADRLGQNAKSWEPFTPEKYYPLPFPQSAANEELPANPGWQPGQQGNKPLVIDKPQDIFSLSSFLKRIAA